jgi:hypothetical protein
MANAWAKKLATALVTAIKADSGIHTVAEDRIYPMGSIVNPTYPYLTYVLPLADRPRHVYAGNSPVSEDVWFQVDGWAATYSSCVDVMDAVIAALDGKTLTITSWGVPRLEATGGMAISDYEIDGVKYWRGMRRYRAILAGTT